MREPPLNVRVLGHPLVAVPIGIGGLAFLYLCWQSPGGEGLIPAIITICLMAWTGKAHDYMNGYRAWKRAWDGMAEPTRRVSVGGWRKALGVVGIALVALYVAASADDPDYQLAMAWMVLVAIVGGVVALWRMKRGGIVASRRRKATDALVQVVARPQVKVPSLATAYRALPDYCQRLMA